MGHACHHLDRLKPFQYRYQPKGVPAPVKGTSTLNQGGACHSPLLKPVYASWLSFRSLALSNLHFRKAVLKESIQLGEELGEELEELIEAFEAGDYQGRSDRSEANLQGIHP